MVAPKRTVLLFDRLKWAKSNRDALRGIRRVGLLVDIAGPLGEMVTERLLRLRLEVRVRERGFELVGPGDDVLTAAKDFAPVVLRVNSSPAGTDRVLSLVARMGVEREVLVRTDGPPVRRWAGLYDADAFVLAPLDVVAEAVLGMVDKIAADVLGEIAAANRPLGLLGDEPPSQNSSDDPTAAPEEPS